MRRRPANTLAANSGELDGDWAAARGPANSPPAGRYWATAVVVGTMMLLGAPALTRADSARSDSKAVVAPRSAPPGVSVRLAEPGAPAWRPLAFRRVERETEYQLGLDPEGRSAFRGASRCAASAMGMALPNDFDLAQTPRLAWRWRIERGLDIEGERAKDGDDFAARLYVLYEFDPESVGTLERLRRNFWRRFFGVEIPGHTINYVWASREPVGATWTSPYHDDTQLVVVASSSATAAASGWKEEIVDLVEDANRLISPPPNRPPYAIGLMVDADNTCSEAIAWFADFRLLGPAPQPQLP